MSDAAYDAEVPERSPLCWRCGKVRVRVTGVPCPACRVILLAEYHERRAANGGRLLYLPENWSPTIMTDRANVVTRMCSECTKEFEIEGPLKGRPPSRCPDCRGESAKPERKPVASKALARVASRAVSPVLPPPAPVAHEANGNGVNVAAVTERVMAEVAELEDAIAVRLRVVRTLEQYAKSAGR